MHEKFKWILLPELVFFQEGPGVRNHQYTNTGIKLLNVANLQGGMLYLDNTNRYISEDEAYGKYKHFLVDEGDLIIASSGIKVEYFDQKMGFAKKEHLPLCMNTSTIRFKTLDSNILNIRYFMYFLKSIFFKKQLARLITGSAQLNFGPSHLKQIKVPLPSIDYQIEIVNILDQAQELIDKRKAQIEALDELIQSVFYDMFGDPVLNTMNWTIEKLGQLTSKITDGKHGDCNNDINSGYYFISAKDIFNGRIHYDNARQIVKEEFEEVHRRTNLEIGDIVMVNTGATIGKLAIATCIEKVSCTTFQKSVAIIKYKREFLNVYFLMKVLENNVKNLHNVSSGSSQKNLLLSQMREFKVICPPIELQNQFAEIVENIEKQKELLNESLVELENNFNSLMQRAFNGEPLC